MQLIVKSTVVFMLLTIILLSALLLTVVLTSDTYAAQNYYKPDKVVYDVSNNQASELSHILDRISLLQRLYDNDPFESSIIVILHEGAIPLFAKSSKLYQPNLIQRVQSLTLNEVIKFQFCKASAKMQGFSQNDFDNFITMIPMADAEIIQLQRQGYAYLR